MKLLNGHLRYSNHIEFVPLLVETLCVKSMAEVGVLHGALSLSILTKCPQVNPLYLIDSWKPFTTPPVYSQETWDQRYASVKAKMKKYGNRVRIVRSTSIEAANQFKTGSLDFVYIDANHSFKFVNEDIKAWWPKVKPTGYLAGHDMIGRWHGVAKAVEVNFGKQYFCGQPTSNWDGVWIVSKENIMGEGRHNENTL